MKKILIASVLALAGVSSSFAANFASGDLILGFRADAGQGVTSNVLVDLGAASGFTADSASLFDLSSILGSTYGSNWATRSDLHYGVFGASGTVTNSTAWASQVESVSGTVETNIFSNSMSGLYAGSTINQGRLGYTTFQAYASALTPVSTDIYVGDATLNTGWTLQEGKSAGASWNFITPYIDTTLANFNTPANASQLDGTAYGALDIYKINKTSTTNLGAIGVNANGNVAFLAFNGTDTNAFSAAVIPEPSTYAMILGALTLGFVALRRRFARAA